MIKNRPMGEVDGEGSEVILFQMLLLLQIRDSVRSFCGPDSVADQIPGYDVSRCEFAPINFWTISAAYAETASAV